LANACSHLQNASLARLGLTSLPRTNQLHGLLLQLQKSGYVNSVTIGGPQPPPPSALSPILSTNPAAKTDVSGHVVVAAAAADGHVPERGSAGEEHREGRGGKGEEKEKEEQEEGLVTQANIASRRLWIGLKYYRNRPVLETMRLVSKPTRRVWMGMRDLDGLVKGEKKGYVRGLRGVGEGLFISTDRGIMEVRECVGRRLGGLVLCRVNAV
ncbi:MAG: hypothetical protein Q9217_007076, partial [Psora testacea]